MLKQGVHVLCGSCSSKVVEELLQRGDHLTPDDVFHPKSLLLQSQPHRVLSVLTRARLSSVDVLLADLLQTTLETLAADTASPAGSDWALK